MIEFIIVCKYPSQQEGTLTDKDDDIFSRNSFLAFVWMSRSLYAFILVSSNIRLSQWEIYKISTIIQYPGLSILDGLTFAIHCYNRVLDLVLTKGCTVSQKLLGYAEKEFIRRYLVAHKIFTYAQEPRPEGLQSGAMPTLPPALLGTPHHCSYFLDNTADSTVWVQDATSATSASCRGMSMWSLFLNACFWGTCSSWPPASESNSAIESSWWMLDHSAASRSGKWILTSNLKKHLDSNF